MGSEKSPPEDSPLGAAGRGFLEGGGPNKLAPAIPDFDKFCLESSAKRRRDDLGPPGLEPGEELVSMCIYLHGTYLHTSLEVYTRITDVYSSL